MCRHNKPERQPIMFTFKRRLFTLGIGSLLLMMMAIASSASALAAGPVDTLTSTLTSPAISVVNNGSATIDSKSLNGQDTSLAIALPLTVTDAGNGAGWHLSIISQQFHTAANATPFR